jgi:hypothetical protein
MFRIFLAVLIALTAVGCRRERLHDSKTPAATGAPEDILRVHWLGKKGLVGNTNTAYLLSIWNLPEAVVLEKQILDKLALAPWRVLGRDTNATLTNTPAALLLRPLLEDALQHETFVSVRRLRESKIDAILAVRLAPERAALWRSNLGGLLQGLPPRCGIRAIPVGDAWRIQSDHCTNYLSLVASQGWTVARIGPKPVTSTQVARLLPKEPWVQSTGTNDWLQLQVHPGVLASILNFPASTACLSRIQFAWASDGEYVRTRGDLEFAESLLYRFEPWTIPTNVIRNPLVSFTAVRGFQAYLENIRFFKDLGISTPPNQFYLWSLQGGPMFNYAAVPFPNATTLMERIGPELQTRWTPWFTNHARSSLAYDPQEHALTWGELPFFSPGFLAVTSNIGDLMLARVGSMTPPPTTKPFPEALIDILNQGTNLVYYEWEITEHKLADLFMIGQGARLMLRKAQLPPTAPSIAFLKAATPKLGNVVTTARLTSPSELRLERKSHLALTAMEWHLMADWFESPLFPLGLHTFTAPTPATVRMNQNTKSLKAGTNAPARRR